MFRFYSTVIHIHIGFSYFKQLNIQYKTILIFHKTQGSDNQNAQGNQTPLQYHPPFRQLLHQYNRSKLGNIRIKRIKCHNPPPYSFRKLIDRIKNRCGTINIIPMKTTCSTGTRDFRKCKNIFGHMSFSAVMRACDEPHCLIGLILIRN